jgi:hypothetical protein
MIDCEIRFRDTGGIISKTVLKKVPEATAPDLTKMLTLVTAIKVHTNAGIAGYSVLTWDETVRAASVTTPVGLNSVKGLITVRYALDGETVTSLLWLPNPNPAQYEMVMGEGLRMIQADREDLASALSTMAGFAVTVAEGKIAIKTNRVGAAKHGTCIVFSDAGGNLGYMGIPQVLASDAAAIATFATALETNENSQSAITSSFYLGRLDATPAAGSGIGLAAADATNDIFTPVETGGKIKMAYTDGGTKKYETLRVGAIKSGSCQGSGKNYKATAVAGNAIVTALNTFYGAGNRVLSFANSKIVSPNFKTQ